MMINKTLFTYCAIFLCCISVNTASALQTVDSKVNIEACQIGSMVEDIQLALNAPNDKQSLQTIIGYGTDSRYYMMIRGWLFQELVAVESQLYAAKKSQDKVRLQRKSDFLKQAIRGMDLE